MNIKEFLLNKRLWTILIIALSGAVLVLLFFPYAIEPGVGFGDTFYRMLDLEGMDESFMVMIILGLPLIWLIVSNTLILSVKKVEGGKCGFIFKIVNIAVSVLILLLILKAIINKADGTSFITAAGVLQVIFGALIFTATAAFLIISIVQNKKKKLAAD